MRDLLEAFVAAAVSVALIAWCVWHAYPLIMYVLSK